MEKLTIQEIAKILVEKNKLTPKEANQFATTMFEVIQQQLDTDGLVKIKGLGTFKMIRVEARESVSVRTGERVTIDSHAKITFTPDAAMKELVNKPFSQFETVVLNDGVEFEDLPDDETEDDAMGSEVVLPTNVVVESPTPIVVEEKPVMQPLLDVVDDTPQEDEHVLAGDEEEEPVSMDNEEEEEPEFVDDEDETGSSWKKTLCYVLLTLVLMAASAYGGYWYGQRTALPMAESPVEEEIEDVPEVVDVDSIEVVEVDSVEVIEQPAVEQPVTETAKKEQVIEEEPFWKKYEAMDVRVRTGAYHIIGTDHEVKVKKGETLSRIARRELGEGMSCYIEVYNGLKADAGLQEGQTIKIPKLKWKIKR